MLSNASNSAILSLNLLLSSITPSCIPCCCSCCIDGAFPIILLLPNGNAICFPN